MLRDAVEAIAAHAPATAADAPTIEQVDDIFIASNPAFGALTALTERDLVAFHLFRESPDDPSPIAAFYRASGFGEQAAVEGAKAFRQQMVADGWTRTAYPQIHKDALHDVYFTITRECDLACPYCYQGLHARRGKEMPLARVAEGLAKVRATNPRAHLVLTGGEPLIHSEIDRVLDLVEAIDLKVTILSNGTHLTAEKAARIKKIPRLRAVQISLDGWSEETHGKTRGRGSFAKVMAGIQNLIDAGVHFILAPTLHSENIHELQAIAEFAISNGGFVSPNNLRHFPHDSNKKAVTADGRTMTPRKAELRNEEVTISPKVVLPNEELMKWLVKVNRALREKFGRELMERLGEQFASTTACSVESPNSRSTCGFGRELIDVDWNGDVYPCHLAKTKELIIGNLFEESFETILTRTEQSGLRVRSYEIPKCSGCKFVSNCGGGCRMGAYFAYGTLKREDDLCEVNYKSNLRKLTMPLRDRDASVRAGSEYDPNVHLAVEADASL